MNKIFFLIATVALFSCNNETKQQSQLPGELKYVAYRWNDSTDSVGISLQHYLNIHAKGDYNLVLRDQEGNARYYYGYIPEEVRAALVEFVKGDQYASEYMSSDSNGTVYNGPQFIFDYMGDSSEKRILFIPPFAPEAIKNIQSKLDSVINGSDKKQRAAFNINDYLRKIIARDSATRLKPPPVKMVPFKTPETR